MPPFFDPASDPTLLNLKGIALRGGDRGPQYDQGVLAVISQIEKEKAFSVNPIGGLILLMLTQQQSGSQLLTDQELNEGRRFLAGRGWTLEEGVEYANGIKCAEGLLSH